MPTDSDDESSDGEGDEHEKYRDHENENEKQQSKDLDGEISGIQLQNLTLDPESGESTAGLRGMI